MSVCRECHCNTGGGDYCYQHAPYTVWPKVDGSFITDRFGRQHVTLEPFERAGESMIASLQLRLLALAIRKVLPPKLLSEVVARLDPLAPFLAALREIPPEPVQLQDQQRAPEWTCVLCGGDVMFCQCNHPEPLTMVMRCSRCGTLNQDDACIDGSADTHTPLPYEIRTRS